MNWSLHLGADPAFPRVSKRESSRRACLLTASRRLEPGESARLVAPDGQAETLDAAQVAAEMDVERAAV